jgi:hypothetical protein
MYIAVYPIAISIRASNVYEERSLGIYSEASDRRRQWQVLYRQANPKPTELRPLVHIPWLLLHLHRRGGQDSRYFDSGKWPSLSLIWASSNGFRLFLYSLCFLKLFQPSELSLMIFSVCSHLTLIQRQCWTQSWISYGRNVSMWAIHGFQQACHLRDDDLRPSPWIAL